MRRMSIETTAKPPLTGSLKPMMRELNSRNYIRNFRMYDVLAIVARIWGESDPIAGAALAVKIFAPERQQDDAIVSIVQRWSLTEPAVVGALVNRFPDGKLRQTALENCVNLWAEQDPESAGEWILGLPADASRDAVVVVYANKVALQFPSFAAEWAEFIGADQLRMRAMKAVAEHWLLRDAEAARDWMAKVSISER